MITFETQKRPFEHHVYAVRPESLSWVEDRATGRRAVALTVSCAMDHGPGVSCSQRSMTLGFESADDIAYLSAFLPIMGQQTFEDYGPKALRLLQVAMELNDKLNSDNEKDDMPRPLHTRPVPADHECNLAPSYADICTFSYHAPGPVAAAMHEEIRAHALHFATHLRDLVPPGTERDMALERFREAVMWANAGLALGPCNGYPIGAPAMPEQAQAEPEQPEQINEDNTEPAPAPQPETDHNPHRLPGDPVGYLAGLPVYDELSRRRAVV